MSKKQQLLNERSRLTDLVAHIEAGRFNFIPVKKFERMLTTEQAAIIRVCAHQHNEVLKKDLAYRLEMSGHPSWPAYAGIERYLEQLTVSWSTTRRAIGQIPRLENKIALLERQLASAKNRIESHFETASALYSALTDEQKNWLADPKPNPKTALDFPGFGHEAVGYYPDERLPMAHVQHGQLTLMIAAIDRELAELEESS